jgi:hypothetical protein
VRIPYVRAGELVTVEPAAGLAFGEAMSGDTVVRDLTLRNRSSVPVSLSSVRFATGRLRLALVDTIDGQTIAPGASLTLRVRAVPMGAVGVHGDSVIVALNCMEVGVSASVTIVEPCIEVSDVDFGVVTPGSFVSRTLQLCNRGRGRLQLKALAGDTAILWDDPAFSINPVFLEQLRTSTLGPSECMSVEVFFLSMKDGTYRTVAHVEPSAGVCRDSSRWTAVVSPAGAVDPAGVDDAALDATIDGRRVTLECDGPGRVVVYDLVGRRVAGPFTVETPRGAVAWDASNLPAGVYYCLFARASGIAVAPVILR